MEIEIITGWKGIMNHLHKIGLDFQLRTIKSWHYERLRMPLRKSHQSTQGRVIIKKADLHQWLEEVMLPKHPQLLHD